MSVKRAVAPETKRYISFEKLKDDKNIALTGPPIPKTPARIPERVPPPILEN